MQSPFSEDDYSELQQLKCNVDKSGMSGHQTVSQSQCGVFQRIADEDELRKQGSGVVENLPQLMKMKSMNGEAMGRKLFISLVSP